MIFSKRLTVGLLSMGAVVMSALPSLARPATITIEANVRSGASLQASILDGLPVGTNVEVLNVAFEPTRRDYWYYLRSYGNLKTEGWVRSNLVQFQASDQTYGTLMGEPDDVINIRSAPTTRSEVVHTGIKGDLVAVGEYRKRSEALGWYYVTFPNQSSGWVRSDLISVWPKD